jgi:hypothetical protein
MNRLIACEMLLNGVFTRTTYNERGNFPKKPKNRLPVSDVRKGSPGPIPQVAEANIPRLMDAAGECLF